MSAYNFDVTVYVFSIAKQHLPKRDKYIMSSLHYPPFPKMLTTNLNSPDVELFGAPGSGSARSPFHAMALLHTCIDHTYYRHEDIRLMPNMER